MKALRAFVGIDMTKYITVVDLRVLATLAIWDTPHENVQATLDILAYQKPEDRHAIAACYLAIIGERQLPANFGTRHAQPVLAKPLKGTARMVRQAEARRILEARRDEA
jgi:hypothetical protein